MGDIGGKPLADESGVETSRLPAAFLHCVGSAAACALGRVQVILVCRCLQTGKYLWCIVFPSSMHVRYRDVQFCETAKQPFDDAFSVVGTERFPKRNS